MQFRIASFICLFFSGSLIYFAASGSTANMAPFLATSALLLVSGLFFLLWPAIKKQDLNAIESLPGTLEEVRKLGREYFRNSSAIQENSATVKHLNDELSRRIESLLPLQKPLEELLFHQRQEAILLRAELEHWQKAVVNHFEYLERSVNLDGVADGLRATFRKTANDFARELKPLGFEIINPQPGDMFDEHFHEWKNDIVTAQPPDQIMIVESIGFRIGSRCVKSAAVTVSRLPDEISIPVTISQSVNSVEEPVFNEASLSELSTSTVKEESP